MKKKLIISILAVIVLLGGFITYIIYDGTHYAPSRLKVRYETIKDTRIPKSMNQIQVIFITDIHYNQFMDEARFQKIVDVINDIEPDIIIFGGDLYDHPSTNIPNETVIETFTQQLKSLKAKLGKYAVYGNHDLESPFTKDLVYQTLTNSDFEVLENENVRVYINTTQYIQLIGLDCELLGNPDMNQAFLFIENDVFTITVSHTPDTITKIPQNPTSLMLSGHSHGGQVYIPIIGALERVPYAEIYNRGKYIVNNIILDVSNGVGTSRQDIRIFSDPEIVVYTLISE
jgi:Predicted phosphohydrolases